MSRRFYSAAHYRRVSPPSDTAADVDDRRRRREAGDRAVRDRERAYPDLTPATAAAAIAYQEQRVAYHLALLRAAATTEGRV